VDNATRVETYYNCTAYTDTNRLNVILDRTTPKLNYSPSIAFGMMDIFGNISLRVFIELHTYFQYERPTIRKANGQTNIIITSFCDSLKITNTQKFVFL
jgi:hypothetical protein